MRIVIPLLAGISLLILPWPIAALLMLPAAYVLPVAGLLLGVLADLLYFVPGAALVPLFSLYGLAIGVGAIFVRRFMKARIIGG